MTRCAWVSARVQLSASGLAVVLLVLALAGCREREDTRPAPPAAVAPEVLPTAVSEVRTLEPGRPVDRDADGSAAHGYRARLDEGEHLHVRVDQDGVDAAVVLLSAEGSSLREVDTPTGHCGREQLWWVATQAGEYRIEVRLPKPIGRYRISIERPRPANDRDRLTTTAQDAYLEGQARSRAREHGLAAESFRDALFLWQRLSEPMQELLSLVDLGWSEVCAQDLELAAAHFEQALDVARSLGEARQEVRVLNLLGLAHRRLDRHAEAAESYRAALGLAQRVHHRSGESIAAHNLAVLFQMRGEAEKALDFYERARVIQRQLGQTSQEADTLRNLGSCYMLLGRLPDALDVLHRALKLSTAVTDSFKVARTLNTIGWYQHLNGQPERAIRYFRRALKVRGDVEPDFTTAGTLDRMGTAYAAMGQRQQAADAYGRALEILRRDGYRLGAGHTLANLCRLHELAGELEAGLETCGRSLEIMQRVGDANGEAYALYLRARLELRRGDRSSALADIEETLDRVEQLRAAAGSETTQIAFFADQFMYYEFYIDLLMELHRREPLAGWNVRALEATERSRARSLLELLAVASTDIQRGVDPALLEGERWLVARIEQKEEQRRSGEESEATERELRELLREYDNIRHRIRLASPAYAAHTRPQPIGLEQIQRLLEDGTLMCAYSLGEERSFLWVIDPTGLESYELPPRAEIERLARAWYELLSDRNRQSAAKGQRQKIARGLSDVLLRPIATRLGDQRLVILSEGALQYIPFAALPMPAETSAKTRPLLFGHEVVHLPSASALALLRDQMSGRPLAPGIVAVVANPVLGSDWGPLPHSSREAASILALASGRTLLIEGLEANRETILSGVLAGYRIVHFATHGVVDASHPELSGLVVSQLDELGSPGSAFLRFHEIYNLELPAELVVLSACSTALGREIRGEGLVGLTRAFYYAGVPRVVVSLWNVADEATAVLMERFYRNLLRNGLGPAAALREAQLEMWREGEWQPYHWAGFLLQGEWRGFDAM